jgi:hypothetical protein
MPAVKSNGIVQFHQGSRDESPQHGTVSWRNKGEEPFATQDAIVCSRIDWDNMAERDSSLLAWATVGLREGFLLAISPAHLTRSLGVVAENGSLGL